MDIALYLSTSAGSTLVIVHSEAGDWFVPLAPPVYVAESVRRVGQAKRGPTNNGEKHGGTALRLSHPTIRNSFTGPRSSRRENWDSPP